MKTLTLKSTKLVHFTISLIILFGCSISASAAVTYCTSSAVGYGKEVTGGGSATPVLVGSVSELQSALNKGKNKVIIITKSLTFTKMLSVQDGSNVTLLGLPGVTLTSTQQDKSNSGILYVKRFTNLIIRNLTFVGPGAYDCDGNDLLCFQDVMNAWVDHCDFQDGVDGNFDNKNGTDNVTVSWCRFRYLKAPKPGGSGGAADHRFTNLLGSSSSDKPSDGTYNLTWAYCWWDDGCKERMVRCRNCDLHFLNCYWNSSVANYYVGPENAKCYFEGCTFEGKANSSSKIFKSYGGTNACKFVDCAGNLPSNAGSVSTPKYTYTASGRAEAKTAVTNATCGAGATLTVTTAGAVSSSCDGGAPLPTVYTVTWDATTNGGTCGTATSSVTSGATISSLPEATKDGYTFDGWYSAPSGGDLISPATTVSGNVTYYAQFTEIVTPPTVYYTVVWDANGGTCAMPSSKIEAGTAVGTLPTADKAGDYSFDGWYTAVNGGTKITALTVISGNVTYYAHYTYTGGGSTGGGGECETLAQGTQNSAHTAIDATIGTITTTGGQSQDGYIKLSGSSSQCFVVTAKSGYTIAAGDRLTVTVYNKNSSATAIGFQINSVAHTVNLAGKTEGQVVYELQSTDINAGTVTIKRNDSGDRYGAILLERCSGSTPPPASNFVLTYDENGGSGTMADDEQTGANVTVKANGFTAPTGYAFKEWNTDMNGGGTTYAAGTAVTLIEDMTLYAIWTPQSYTVTLNAKGGAGGSSNVTATFDAALPNITVPTQSGYVFKGYFTEAEGAGTQYYDENGSSTNNWTIPSETTLNAYWEAGTTPDMTGCSLRFYFYNPDDAETNSVEQNKGSFFTMSTVELSSMEGSITIDGISYTITKRSKDIATFGSFTIPSGHTGVFYALAVSSGDGDRQINLVGGTTYELDVPGGSGSYKRIESEELPAGTYSIQREGSSNVRLGVVVVKICESLSPSDAPVITAQPTGGTYNVGDPIAALSVTATGSGTLTYQWKKDGVNISGATSSTYTPSSAGTYTCVVTNTEDGKSPTSITSDEAEITIIDPSVKECTVLISYTMSGVTTGKDITVPIGADKDNLVGGNAYYNVSTESIDGGYKLGGNGKYVGVVLASGQFKAGDKVTVTITKKSDQGDNGLHLSTSKNGAAVVSIAADDVVVGDNVFTLTADCDAIYVARGSVAQNPYVKAISVCRELSQYTVTFDKNNASATGTMSNQSFYEGFAAKLTANSFKLTDYVFAGWATVPDGSKVYDDKQSVTMTDNITLYAIWEPARYTLTSAVNPAGYGSVDVASVDNIPPHTPTSSSANTYTVNGTTVTATPSATTAEYTYAFDSWSGLPATVTEDATVTATFTRTPRNYTVTLHTNEGTINSGDVTGYIFGIGATLPTDVTKAGAEFGGWYNNSGLSGSAVTEITTTETDDKEYWAKWITCPAANSGVTLYKFEVNSSVANGNICSAKNEPVNIVPPTQLSTLIGGTLQGMVTSTSYNNLTFNGGRITFANGDKGVLIITLDCPLQEGDLIRFNNYSSSNDKYNYLRHTSHSTSDNQLTLPASKSQTELQSVLAPAAFAGETELYIVSGARTTGISFFEIIRSCAVLLNANGGKVGGEDTKTVRGAIGDEVALPHAFKDGEKFKGWYDAPSGGTAVSNPYTIAGPTTLYAQYEDCPDEGTLYKFEVRTGLTNGSVTANDVDFEFTTANYLTALIGGTLTTGGSKASKVTITGNNALNVTDNAAYLKIDLDCEIHEGDVFKSTISSNTLYVTNATTRTKTVELPIGTLVQTPVPESLIGEKTLYIWKGNGDGNALSYFEIVRPKQAVITLNASGAYNKYTTSVVAFYEQSMPEIMVLPKRTGYVFYGYYDSPDGGGTQYYDGMGYSVHDWDKDVKTATLYAYWLDPCNASPTLERIAPEVTIWDAQKVDLALVRLTCGYDTTGIQYSLLSASEAIAGCTFSYFDERIYIQGTPALGNTSTVTKTITFTMTNNCSPAHTYTVDATIRIYPAGQKAKIAYIITGTEGGAFTAYRTADESASADLLAYLGTFYDVTCVNGYATKNEAEIAEYYAPYDLLIVTDFLETPKGYTNAIGTLIDKKPILSFEAYVAGENGSNWHIGSNPKDPSPAVQAMKVLCAGHAIFKDAEDVDVINDADTTVTVISSVSGKGLQGFVINEAPDFIFLATVRDADNNRDLIVCCERQVVFPARLLVYGINYNEMGNLSPAGKVVMHQMIEYLLMTDETKVADCSLVFDNNNGTHLWSDPLNWAPGYNIIPTPYIGARIIAECHVDVDNAHAGHVRINKGKDEHGKTVDGKLIIEPNGGLTIAAVVQQVNDTRYASPITIKAEDLLIESDETGNGAFVYGNKESDVRATVQYYSLAEGASTTTPVWQYMGTPFQAGQTAIGMYYEAWMCRWAEGTKDGLGGLWQWVENEDVLLPFEGYCITQESKKTYTFAGKLNAPVTTTLLLDNRDEEGYAFAANSWTAPIKIQEMQDEDFTNAEKTIYIYHSGSYANWTANGTPVSAKNGAVAELPGQYAVVPIHASPYILGADSVIPAMQGFFVKTTDAGATLDLVYNRVVYDATYFKTSTQPMRSPRRAAREGNPPDVMRLLVAGTSFGGDQVHLLSRSDFSEQYEDGWDGRKIDGDEAAPQLAVVKESGEMAVAAISELEGRELSFRAGKDSEYTFHFDYEGELIYLYDRMTHEATEIRSGNTYTFEASNQTSVNRFLITATPPHVPTDTRSVVFEGSDDKPVKYIDQDRIYILYRGRIYDVTGKSVIPEPRKEVAP